MYKKNSFKGRKGGKNFGGGFRDQRPALHEAICSQCDAMCKVPFKPNGSKPILCRDCFRGEEGGGNRYERSNSFEKPAYRSQPRSNDSDVVRQLEMLNAKMDQLLRALGGERGGRGSFEKRKRGRF